MCPLSGPFIYLIYYCCYHESHNREDDKTRENIAIDLVKWKWIH